jgi:DNA end-binding protein Ku
MRAIWSGAITFGLVNVPVKLYGATEDHDVQLHQVHDADGGRIRYQRTCEVCDQVVPYAHIDRAYADDEDTVVLTKDDFATIPQERDREISVVEFVPTEQIEPILFERTYYLAPSGKSSKAYVLLRRTLEKTNRTAVVQFALRQKTRLAALRVRNDILVLHTLLWPDEVREPTFDALDERVRISNKELQLSASLVKSFSDDFTPERFRDEYQEQLRALIAKKKASGEALDTEDTFGEEDQGGEVIDLMEALKASVQRSRAAKKQQSRSSRPKSGASRASAKPKSTSKSQRKSSSKTSKASAAAKTQKSRGTSHASSTSEKRNRSGA